MAENSQCQWDIDLLTADECVGRKARLVLDPDLVGHVIRVNIHPGNRAYTLEWPVDGSMHQGDFYGFQLDLLEE